MRVTEVPRGPTPEPGKVSVPQFEGVVLWTAPLTLACYSELVSLSDTEDTDIIWSWAWVPKLPFALQQNSST